MEEKKINQAIYKIIIDNISENNRIRKKNLMLKIFVIIMLLLFIFANMHNKSYYHTAIIKIEGEISSGSFANAKDIIKSINLAYENKYTKGIILEINSPGGSPVQSQLIYKELTRLKKMYPKIPVYSVIKDIGASAAYMIACGSDKIYADEMSIIGSIGVLISTFGFENFMKKIGVERRLYTSGKFKGFLDPYSKINNEQKKIINYQLKMMHKLFIKRVMEGRKNLIKVTPLIFSGLTWVGSDAFNIGLIDGFGDTNYIAREKIKSEHTINYTHARGFFNNMKSQYIENIRQTFFNLKNKISFSHI